MSEALLHRMEIGDIARREADGAISVSRRADSGLIAYGPWLRLAAGTYRLTFACDPGQPFRAGQPVLGLEVIAQDRVQLAWRDYTADEFPGGQGKLEFVVPPPLSVASGEDIPIEFRLLHLGNAGVRITSLTLTSNIGQLAYPGPARLWRLLGRLYLRGLPLHRDGNISMGRANPLPWLSNRCLPLLMLPTGHYQMVLRAHPTAGGDREVLEAQIATRDGQVLARQRFSARTLAADGGRLEFDVPEELSLEGGGKVFFDIRLTRLGLSRVRLSAVDLRLLSDIRPPDARAAAMFAPMIPAPAAPALATSTTSQRANIVVVGNCQAGNVADAFRESDDLATRFRTVHHEAHMQANLLETGRRDIERADIVLVQTIQEWERYPLRAHIPPGARIIEFPCLRFASLWPFDAFNGMPDTVARSRDLPNYQLTYFDGVLARLRTEVPDHTARLAAYRALAIENIPDARRLHRFEERRLAAMDMKFPAGIGAYVLENFRRKPFLFYTTGHPNADLFVLLLNEITRQLELKTRVKKLRMMDSLKNLQVPVHPRVAEQLGVNWVNDATTYLFRGQHLTWEQYFAHYIAYYG